MSINAALRELFAHKTQKTIAAELTAMGLAAEQTKVSAWTRDRQPTLEQISMIEQWAGKPQGWVLARAGYVTLADVEPIGARPASPTNDDLIVALEARLVKLERQINQQRALLRKLAMASEALGLELDDDDSLSGDATLAVPTTEEGRR